MTFAVILFLGCLASAAFTAFCVMDAETTGDWRFGALVICAACVFGVVTLARAGAL